MQLCALGFQQQLQDLGVDGVILGAEELHAGQGRSFFCFLREHLCRLHRICFGINGKFQHDLKAGTPAGGALHADGTAHQVYDAPGDGHAKAGTLHLIGAGFFLAGKGVKKGLLKLLAHADAVIAAAAAVIPQTCKNERREIFFII